MIRGLKVVFFFSQLEQVSSRILTPDHHSLANALDVLHIHAATFVLNYFLVIWTSPVGFDVLELIHAQWILHEQITLLQVLIKLCWCWPWMEFAEVFDAVENVVLQTFLCLSDFLLSPVTHGLGLKKTTDKGACLFLHLLLMFYWNSLRSSRQSISCRQVVSSYVNDLIRKSQISFGSAVFLE